MSTKREEISDRGNKLQVLIDKFQAGELTAEERSTITMILEWIRDNSPWADSEVQALIDDLKKDCNNTVDRAVAEAAIPLIAENTVLKIEVKDLRQRVVWTGVGCVALGLLIGYVAYELSH